MKRLTTLLLVASTGLLAACTTNPPATPDPTVTHTVTEPAPTAGGAEPAADEHPLPCDAVHVETTIAPGEGPAPDVWDTAIVLTNLGPEVCTLEGASELEFLTGGDGQELGIKEITTDDGVPPEQVLVEVGDQAAMSLDVPTTADDPASRPDCLANGSFAHITLPGDKQPIEAWPADRSQGLPPVCGPVSVTDWSHGGAPGVSPN
jgi:hypothetical protein